jgi:hypothetical protein
VELIYSVVSLGGSSNVRQEMLIKKKLDEKCVLHETIYLAMNMISLFLYIKLHTSFFTYNGY